METTIGERFNQLIESQGLTTNAFANSLGKPYTSIKVILDGTSKPGFDLLERILVTYPKISRDWLIMGEGDIFRQSEKPMDNSSFGDQVITNMAKDIDGIRHFFEEELRAKNRQIDSLQEMLKMAMTTKTKEGSFLNGVSYEGRIVPLNSKIEKATA